MRPPPDSAEHRRRILWAIHRAITKPWAAGTPEDLHFLALATCGEVGELANLIKKDWVDRPPFRPRTEVKAAIADEIADSYMYLELLAIVAGVDIDEACANKLRVLLDERYVDYREAIQRNLEEASQ